MPDLHDLFQRRIVLPVNAGTACRKTDIQYTTTQGDARAFDLYLPQALSKNGFPVIIFIHGEAPIEHLKDSGQYVSMGEWLANQGIASIVFDHAMLAQGKRIDDVLSDIRELLRHVIAHHAQYDFDQKRIGVWAFSGGVQFALYLALKEFRHQIKTLALYYGCMTIRDFLDMFAAFMPIDTHLGDDYDDIEELCEQSENFPAIFIARAGLDMAVINRSIDQSVPAFLRKNIRLALHNHEQGQHAFDILDDVPRSREILQATLHFIQQTFAQTNSMD